MNVCYPIIAVNVDWARIQCCNHARASDCRSSCVQVRNTVIFLNHYSPVMFDKSSQLAQSSFPILPPFLYGMLLLLAFFLLILAVFRYHIFFVMANTATGLHPQTQRGKPSNYY